jgi:hypothetical protein
MYTNLSKYVLNLFGNMLTAGLPHTAAPLDNRTLLRAPPDCRTLLRAPPDSRTLLRTLPHTAAHCCTLHEIKCRTAHTAYCTPHTVAHRN